MSSSTCRFFGNQTKSCLSWSHTVIGTFLYRWLSIQRECSLWRPDIAMSSRAPRVLSSVSSAIMSSTIKSVFLPEKNAESSLIHSNSLPPGLKRKTRSSSLIQHLARYVLLYRKVGHKIRYSQIDLCIRFQEDRAFYESFRNQSKQRRLKSKLPYEVQKTKALLYLSKPSWLSVGTRILQSDIHLHCKNRRAWGTCKHPDQTLNLPRNFLTKKLSLFSLSSQPLFPASPNRSQRSTLDASRRERNKLSDCIRMPSLSHQNKYETLYRDRFHRSHKSW